MQRFFIPPDLLNNDTITFTGPLAHQLGYVLRLAKGDVIVVLDGKDHAAEVSLTLFNRESVTGKIVKRFAAPSEPELKVTLYQSVLKGARFDFALEKAVELGVARIVPIITDRTVVRPSKADLHHKKDDDEKSGREKRWEAIVREAAEQAKRGRLPELAETITLAEAFKEIAAQENTLSIIPWEEEESTTLTEVIPGMRGVINVFIGPEGGFTPAEVQTAHNYGIIAVTLGPRILRAETAGLAVVAALMYSSGEWNGK